jgi:cell division protease FtsH
MLNVMMGGRAAEMLIFNEMTTGAGDDIEKATNIARKMVCEWGMSEKLGPMTFGKKNEEVFLGRDFHSERNYSDETASLIDEEVVKIIRKAESNADKILAKNIEILHRMADELLKHETLDSADIEKILDGKTIRRSKNGKAKASSAKKKKAARKKSAKKD